MQGRRNGYVDCISEAISEKIWHSKYRYHHNGEILEQTIEDTWMRVARAVAGEEQKKNQAQWQQAFYDLLSDFRFLPGGRILAGPGPSIP